VAYVNDNTEYGKAWDRTPRSRPEAKGVKTAAMRRSTPRPRTLGHREQDQGLGRRCPVLPAGYYARSGRPRSSWPTPREGDVCQRRGSLDPGFVKGRRSRGRRAPPELPLQPGRDLDRKLKDSHRFKSKLGREPRCIAEAYDAAGILIKGSGREYRRVRRWSTLVENKVACTTAFQTIEFESNGNSSA